MHDELFARSTALKFANAIAKPPQKLSLRPSTVIYSINNLMMGEIGSEYELLQVLWCSFSIVGKILSDNIILIFHLGDIYRKQKYKNITVVPYTCNFIYECNFVFVTSFLIEYKLYRWRCQAMTRNIVGHVGS